MIEGRLQMSGKKMVVRDHEVGEGDYVKLPDEPSPLPVEAREGVLVVASEGFLWGDKKTWTQLSIYLGLKVKLEPKRGPG
jgi:hypothetical protein